MINKGVLVMKKSSKLRNKFDYKDVAGILGVTYITVARLCREGKIKSKKIAGKYYINKSDLNKYMNKDTNIFDRPKAEIIDVIKEGIKLANEESMKNLEYKIKEMLCEILDKKIKGNLEKSESYNKKIEKDSPEIAKHYRYRGESIKKELQKI